MCGIVGIISENPGVRAPIVAMRDALSHRGPDGVGVLDTGHVALGHTRLRVIDTSDHGAQPMSTMDGRFTIVYNGELYNDHEVRSELASMGVVFRTGCDTETVLHAVAVWGLGAGDRLRGMYALCVVDHGSGMCVLARDPLGIKPLYKSTLGDGSLVFGSEVGALLEHPLVSDDPDPGSMSAYVTNIRPGYGGRTMFRAIGSHEPGRWSLVSLSTRGVIASRVVTTDPVHGARDPGETRGVIEDSVVRHLRTDVPMCALLSGGLDSAIVCSIAKARLGTLHTFCAGARGTGHDDDFAFAQALSERIGSEHTEVEVSRDVFLSRWIEMIDESCVPISTPNEIAIDRVSRSLRDMGFVVALSGEGADELFGGYEVPMRQALAFAESGDETRAGAFHLLTNAWMNPEHKDVMCTSAMLESSDSDGKLAGWYQRVYERARASCDDPVQAHLLFHQRVNLTNLLRRLDARTMRHGVEGRTPFADLEVARFANAIPMGFKFVGSDPALTKQCLREAFAADLPESIVSRPKASFPMPFERWVSSMAPVLLSSEIAREWFTESAIELVARDATRHWNLAWPMLNLVLWGERMYGDRGLARRVLDEQAAVPA